MKPNLRFRLVWGRLILLLSILPLRVIISCFYGQHKYEIKVYVYSKKVDKKGLFLLKIVLFWVKIG